MESRKSVDHVVLLVEDNVDDANLMQIFFKHNYPDYQILPVAEVEEALAYLFGNKELLECSSARLKQLPVMILLDLNLPKISGVQFLQLLKANPFTCQIPVVILTGIRNHPDFWECKKLGVHSFLLKADDGSKPPIPMGDLSLDWFVQTIKSVKAGSMLKPKRS